MYVACRFRHFFCGAPWSLKGGGGGAAAESFLMAHTGGGCLVLVRLVLGSPCGLRTAGNKLIRCFEPAPAPLFELAPPKLKS
jgi:hypothetical protein